MDLDLGRSKPLAFYFGCKNDAGHFLWSPETGLYITQPMRDVPGFPWDWGMLDAKLLMNRRVPDQPDGHVYWTAGGSPTWLAFFWWDRSFDTRGASNSGFYVRGFSFLDRQLALDYACQQWPSIVARQQFPLVLQP